MASEGLMASESPPESPSVTTDSPGQEGLRTPSQGLASFWLGRAPYGPAWDLQKELARRVHLAHGGSPGAAQNALDAARGSLDAARGSLGAARSSSGSSAPAQGSLGAARGSPGAAGLMLLLEHPPTYTLGRNAREEDVLVARGSHTAEVQVHRIDRGGGVTYHGPGQLVGYPIINLRRRGLGVKEYIYRMEQGLIDLLGEYGIASEREEGLPGIWVAGKKIAAIGVRVSRGVTTHGFALNVNPDLTYFGGIIPCGMPHREPASMAQLLPPERVPPLDEIQAKAALHLGEALGFGGGVSRPAPWPARADSLMPEPRAETG